MSDIATGLSRENRFAGQTTRDREGYKVAMHSLLVAALVRQEFGRPDLVGQALLHDATEAYMKDIPSPLKRLIPKYKEIESVLLGTILRKFGQADDLNPVVHEADWMAYCIEREVLMPYHSTEVDTRSRRETTLPENRAYWFGMVSTAGEVKARESYLTAVSGWNAGWLSK
jgi:5'-deoxynucleotidase YfbR-like HD superfamily hydrolase